jgi:hypothetical protein
MPKVSWSAFLERLPAAHLIVGVLPEDEAATSNARPQLNLMAALIGRLAPKGLYALSIDRQGRTPEIHCVFEKDADALKLANAVQADRVGSRAIRRVETALPPIKLSRGGPVVRHDGVRHDALRPNKVGVRPVVVVVVLQAVVPRLVVRRRVRHIGDIDVA